MSENVHNIKETEFEEVLKNNDGLVLVDFWAPWCGPCKAIAPTLEELAKDFAGKVTIVKINVDENQTLPATYGVRGIPNLVLFKKGEKADQKVGQQTKTTLTEWIESHIAE
jgi:thioredoxin 1